MRLEVISINFPFFSFAEKQFLPKDNDQTGNYVDDDDDDDVIELQKAKKREDVESALMEKLTTAMATDEETYKLDGKATKNAKSEKKEFRKKVLDYVLEKLPGLESRSKRAGLVHNFLRGLRLGSPQGICPYP